MLSELIHLCLDLFFCTGVFADTRHKVLELFIFLVFELLSDSLSVAFLSLSLFNH
jgi:hypothetical protein